jgi:hypothetical protein
MTHLVASTAPDASATGTFAGATDVENVSMMRILDGAEIDHSPPTPRAGDRNLARQIDERFEDRFASAKRVPRGWERVRTRDRHCPFRRSRKPRSSGRPRDRRHTGARSASDRIGSNGATGSLWYMSNVFSLRRC